MILVSEFDAGVFDFIRGKFCSAVALGPQAGSVLNCGAWLCANPADYAIDRLGQPVNFSFYVAVKARL